jgi:hypothetical protein
LANNVAVCPALDEASAPLGVKVIVGLGGQVPQGSRHPELNIVSAKSIKQKRKPELSNLAGKVG